MQTKADLEKTIADQKESIKFHQWVTGILIVAFLALVAWHMQTSYNEAKDVTKARADIDAFALLKKTATTNDSERLKLRLEIDNCKTQMANFQSLAESNSVRVIELLDMYASRHASICRNQLIVVQTERIVSEQVTGKLPKRTDLMTSRLYCPADGNYIFSETNASVKCSIPGHAPFGTTLPPDPKKG